jgi:hypothetical protein
MKKRIKDKLKRNRKKLSPLEIEQRELKIIQQNLFNARKMRDLLGKAVQEKGDPEGLEHLAKLDAAIIFEEKQFSSRIAAGMRREFSLLAKDLHATVDGFDDDDLLRLGDEAQPVKNLKAFINSRDNLAEVINNLPADENPEQIIADFDKVIAEVGEKLERKRDNALRRAEEAAEAERSYNETQALYKKVFPNHVDLRAQLNDAYKDSERTPLLPDGTEYDMSEDYKDAVYRWEAACDMRDLILRQIEKMKSENRGGKALDDLARSVEELDEWIKNTEILLKEEKQAHQELRRAQDAAEAYVDDYENTLQDAIAQNPHILLGNRKKGD